MAKNITIIVLALLLGGLLVFTFTRGDSVPQATFDKIRREQIESIRSNRITEGQLIISISAVGRLEAILAERDRRIRDILDTLSAGNTEAEIYLDEYGGINNDLREFLFSDLDPRNIIMMPHPDFSKS